MDPSPLNAKSSVCRRRLLLPLPEQVDQRDLDSKVHDSSQEHRMKMRDELYGHSRTARLNLVKANVYCEAGDHSVNYADEPPPKWVSTFKAEYTPKVSDVDAAKIRQVANEIKRNHFTFAETDTSDRAYLSMTKKDFCIKEQEAQPSEKIDYKARIIAYSMYPPIYQDEGHMRMDTKQELEAKRNPKNSQKEYPLPKRCLDTDPAKKSMTHFTLGNDPISYESVTKSTMKPLNTVDQVHYDRTERVPSTVLDYPDMGPVDRRSVHQQDYSDTSKVDKNSLIVNTKEFIQDLKSTHFQLGDGQTHIKHSQYKNSFTKQNSDALNTKNHQLPPSAFPAPRQCIIVEDYEQRETGKSSQREDYGACSIKELERQHASYANGYKMNKMNSKSSVCFGMDSMHGLSKSSTSVSNADYRRPKDTDEKIAQDAYSKKGICTKPDIPSYDLIKMSSDGHLESKSVCQSDFIRPIKSKQTAALDCNENKNYLRTHHFSLGDMHAGYRNVETTAHAHFKDPKSNHLTLTDVGAFPSSKPCTNQFENTLMNTISRYPNDPMTYETVMSTTYKPILNGQRSLPVKPKGDLVGEYLHAGLQDSKLINATLTTVSRTSYLPPEVMKFTQPKDASGISTVVSRHG